MAFKNRNGDEESQVYSKNVQYKVSHQTQRTSRALILESFILPEMPVQSAIVNPGLATQHIQLMKTMMILMYLDSLVGWWTIYCTR